MAEDIVRELLQDSATLQKKRHTVNEMYLLRTKYEPTWKQLSKYINPYRGRFDESPAEEGKRRDYFLFDPLPQMAHAKCAAGIHSGLTSPSRPWFELRLADEEMSQEHNVRMWLDDVKDIMMAVYAKSNIYNALQQIEAELSQFGTAACLLIQDYSTGIWARPYTCGEYAGEVDDRGRVVKFARKMKMHAHQMIAAFGKDAVSEGVKSAYAANNLSAWFDVWMLIEKNPNYDPEKMELGNFPWRSFYFEASSDKFLKVSGYYEVPFLMPRWNVVANAVYGTGPGHDALGNAMQLQKLERIDLRLLDNRANPPLVVPTSVAQVNRLPGEITQVADGSQAQITPLFADTGSREDINQKIQLKQQQIQSAFFNDLFTMLTVQDNPQMTAREVAERHEEKLLMLAPVLEQMHNEVLAPLTQRTFGILNRNGVLPPTPEGVDPSTIKVEFVSLLAQAQQMVAVPAIEKTMQFIGNLAGLVPDIVDNIDFDKALREHASMNGAPEIILRDAGDVEDMRQQRAEQQAQEKKMEQAAAMAKPLKDSVDAARLLSQTRVTPDSTLANMMGGVGI